ncbi:MAG TPA: hypothetical protein VK955_04630 [Xanthobacteraceae bacterium]|nr:hypothetical protein [Xanthobacteraceae bacterium]
MLSLIFLVAALVLFIVAAIGVPAGRFNLAAAGLACYVASLLVTRAVGG